MNCPYCQFDDTRVIETRSSGDSVRRRRECERCKRRFTTQERVEARMPVVVKKGGNREPFERAKLLAGISLACRKRPIPADRLDDAVTALELDLQQSGAREVSSNELGRMVLETLKDMDPVAYLRFASVYYELESAEAFLELARALTRGEGRD